MIHFDKASFETTISQLLSETTFHEYINRRQQHNNGEIQMAIHPWEIKQKN
jgi:hypothetical protein